MAGRSLLLWMVLALIALPGSLGQGWRPQTQQPPDILAWLEGFASMPPGAQTAILMMAGENLKQQFGLTCNIFGGAPACQPLPSDTSYLQQCASAAESKVDCAVVEAVKHNLYDSPVDDLQGYLAANLGKTFKDACPQCFDRLQEMWCALAVPSCGTINKQLQAGLLPVLSQAVKEYARQSSGNRADAVAPVMPDFLGLAQIGLPCREMCEAAINTCSCDQQQNTLGALLTWLASQPTLQGKAGLPLTYARTLFKNVWDRPFCSLFPAQAETDKVGRCTLPTTQSQCSNPGKWCTTSGNQGTDVSKYVQSILLLQFLRATTGWVTNDNAILWGIHTNVRDATMDQQQQAAAYEAVRDSSRAGQVIGIVFLSMFCVSLLAAGAVKGLRWWQQRTRQQGYMELAANEELINLVPSH